jgi:hypothetical protein
MQNYSRVGTQIYLNGELYARIDDDEVYRYKPLGWLGDWDNERQVWTHLTGIETFLPNTNKSS